MAAKIEIPKEILEPLWNNPENSLKDIIRLLLDNHNIKIADSALMRKGKEHNLAKRSTIINTILVPKEILELLWYKEGTTYIDIITSLKNDYNISTCEDTLRTYGKRYGFTDRGILSNTNIPTNIPKHILKKLWYNKLLPNIPSIVEILYREENIKCSEDIVSKRAKEYGFPTRKLLGILKESIIDDNLSEAEKLWKSPNHYMSEITDKYNIDYRTLHKRAELYNWGPFIEVKYTQLPKEGFTKEFILKILNFDFETGEISWNEHRGSIAKKGDKAGCIDEGYLRIQVADKLHMASHLIWLAYYGIYPPYIEKSIGHKDQNKSNITIDNLFIIEISEEDNYYNRVVRQTPKDVNKKLMKAIRDNCPKGYQVDHIHPISLGGLNEPDNLQYLTKEDNQKKSNRLDYNYIMKPIKWQDIIGKEEI